MEKKFMKPENLRSIFEALKIERGHKRYCISEDDQRKGAALLAEWRESSPLDDRRLGAATIIAAVEANPKGISGVRLAAAAAPQDIQSLVFLHGVVAGFARDTGEEASDQVRQLF